MSYSILLVDDDPNLLAALRRCLQADGFRIRCASGPDEALRLMRGDQIHLVISDQVMPGMSGREFLNQVHRLFPDIVCFMFTGHATLEMVIDAINHGGIERVYLKPCDPAELAEGIRKVLREHELLARAIQKFEELEVAQNANTTTGARKPREIELPDASFGWQTMMRRLEKLTDWN